MFRCNISARYSLFCHDRPTQSGSEPAPFAKLGSAVRLLYVIQCRIMVFIGRIVFLPDVPVRPTRFVKQLREKDCCWCRHIRDIVFDCGRSDSSGPLPRLFLHQSALPVRRFRIRHSSISDIRSTATGHRRTCFSGRSGSHSPDRRDIHPVRLYSQTVSLLFHHLLGTCCNTNIYIRN